MLAHENQEMKRSIMEAERKLQEIKSANYSIVDSLINKDTSEPFLVEKLANRNRSKLSKEEAKLIALNKKTNNLISGSSSFRQSHEAAEKPRPVV